MEEGHSYADHLPETPAPQFALRALKSALLGTPQFKQHHVLDSDEQADAAASNTLKPIIEQTSSHSRLQTSLSPTKGILVTPGTGVNKNKTVSFGLSPPGAEDGSSTTQPTASESMEATLRKSRVQECPSPAKEGNASLTTSVFQAQIAGSKRRMQKDSVRKSLDTENVAPLTNEANDRPTGETGNTPRMPETTIDLNLPFSKSGKHWKGEYEQYYRKSNRELKHIIQRRQTMKSYAQRKDQEATSLNAKLEVELGKVARLESRISELAAELASVRFESVTADGASEALVSDLAKQTTSAIHSMQKAEKYKSALKKCEQINIESGQAENFIRISLEGDSITRQDADNHELSILRVQTEQLKSTVASAEKKTLRLELENKTLKQQMARVKVEMRNYETRRLAREERLKRREVKLKSAKESCEAKFADLTSEHARLLSMQDDRRYIQTSKYPSTPARSNNFERTDLQSAKAKQDPALGKLKDEERKYGALHSLQERHAALATWTQGNRENRLASMTCETGIFNDSADLRQKSKILDSDQHAIAESIVDQSTEPNPEVFQIAKTDIWAQERQGYLVDESPTSVGASKDSDFRLLLRETNDALMEVDQNRFSICGGDSDATPRILKTANKDIAPSTCLKACRNRSVIGPPQPSLFKFDSRPQRPITHRRPPDSRSDTSNKSFGDASMNGRALTMGWERGRLPPERAEAARRRLEAKKGERISHLETAT